MRKNRNTVVLATIGNRQCWHPYGLQALAPERFQAVVNAIMEGEQTLLPLARPRRPAPFQPALLESPRLFPG